mgnify:FL=1
MKVNMFSNFMKKVFPEFMVLLLIILILLTMNSCTFADRINSRGDISHEAGEIGIPTNGNGNEINETGNRNGNGGEDVTGKNCPNGSNDGEKQPDEIGGEKNTASKGLVDELLENMTLEEKVGQLFYICFRKDAAGNDVTMLTDHIAEILKKFTPGGVILFSENIKNPSQTVAFIDALQKNSGIPLFIGVDEEGGTVSRLNASPDMHATPLPGNLAIGHTGDRELAYEAGKVIGEELCSLGFNMNFAPVADILTNSENQVIGSRSFGSDPKLVGEMVEMMIKGLQESHMATVIKHFPGHGDTRLDSHTGEVIVEHGIDRLRKMEFIPFEYGIRAGTDAVMTAHIKLPNVTDNGLPASLSPYINFDILREELKFNGLIITDALDMGAVARYWEPGEAALLAVKGGADMVLMPLSLEEAYNAILEEAQNGGIPLERIDKSVRRILTVKERLGILTNERSRPDPEITLGNREHLEIAKSIREWQK